MSASLLVTCLAGCAGTESNAYLNSDWARYGGICQTEGEALSTMQNCRRPDLSVNDHRSPSSMDVFRGRGVATIRHRHLDCSLFVVSCTSASVTMQTMQLDDECRVLIPLGQQLPEGGAVCRVPIVQPAAKIRKHAMFYYFALSFSQDYVPIHPVNLYRVYPLAHR